MASLCGLPVWLDGFLTAWQLAFPQSEYPKKTSQAKTVPLLRPTCQVTERRFATLLGEAGHKPSSGSQQTDGEPTSSSKSM